MKTEVRDIVVGMANQVPGVTGYLATGQLIIMALTGILLIVQVLYYIRKWWREETDWGIRLRRWAEKKGITRPAELMELDE